MAYDEGVTQDSPAGTAVDSGVDPSAGTQNTGFPTPAEHTIPYSRFKEVNDRSHHEASRAAAAEARAQMLEQQGQEYQQRLAALEQRLTQRANQPSRSPQDEEQRQQALTALRGLQADDPEYVRMQTFAKHGPALAQTVVQLRDQMAQMEARSAQSYVRGETARLQTLAGEAGLTFKTPAQFAEFENYVAGIIRSDPAAHAAFRDGDPSILPQALQVARRQYDAVRTSAQAALTQTKNATRALPPRMGGSQPGAGALPQFDPKDPRGSMAKVHAAASAALSDRLVG